MLPNPSAPSLRQSHRKLCLLLSIATCSITSFWLMARQLSTGGDSGGGGVGEEWISGIPNPLNTNTSVFPVERAMEGVRKSSGNNTLPRILPPNINITASIPQVASVPPRPPPSPRLRGTAIIQLWGELGNHLSIFAFYYAVRTIASSEFQLDLTLHVRKQKASKAASAANNSRCIKSFRDLNFDECDDDDDNNRTKGDRCMDKIDNQMTALHDPNIALTNNSTMLRWIHDLHMTGSTSDDIRSFLRSYVSMLTDDSIIDLFNKREVGWSTKERHPFLFAIDRLHVSDALIDEFYGSGGLQEYFAFDNETKMDNGCCSSLPDDDEQVFHYRSFVVDLPTRHMGWGGAELTPTNAANLLSAGLSPGSKVALVSGRSHGDRVRAYERAFEDRSLVVRVIADQTSIQDFCFLAHARAGLWGTVQSSYVRWASLISKDLQTATLYGVNYPAREENITKGRVAKNPDLARIVHFPVFDVSDEDVW